MLLFVARRHVTAYLGISVSLIWSLVHALLVEHLRFVALAVATAFIVLLSLGVPGRLLSDPMLDVKERCAPLELWVLLLVCGARLRIQTTARLRVLAQEVARRTGRRKTVGAKASHVVGGAATLKHTVRQ